jgi:hypothetical protein
MIVRFEIRVEQRGYQQTAGDQSHNPRSGRPGNQRVGRADPPGRAETHLDSQECEPNTAANNKEIRK